MESAITVIIFLVDDSVSDGSPFNLSESNEKAAGWVDDRSVGVDLSSNFIGGKIIFD